MTKGGALLLFLLGYTWIWDPVCSNQGNLRRLSPTFFALSVDLTFDIVYIILLQITSSETTKLMQSWDVEVQF